MQHGEWLVSRKRNEVLITLKGKQINVRITLHQMQRYEEWAKAASGNEQGGMIRLYNDALDIAEIALNPIPNQVDFTREEIEAELDIDQVRLFAQTWIQRKVFEPRLEADPILGPQNPAGEGAKAK